MPSQRRKLTWLLFPITAVCLVWAGWNGPTLIDLWERSTANYKAGENPYESMRDFFSDGPTLILESLEDEAFELPAPAEWPETPPGASAEQRMLDKRFILSEAERQAAEDEWRREQAREEAQFRQKQAELKWDF